MNFAISTSASALLALLLAALPLSAAGTSPETPYDAPSFQRFVARCERDHRPYMLSLRELAEDYQRSVRPGTMPPQKFRDLRFNSFFGYWIDRDQGDVYLLGLYDPALPPVNFDCLVTALRAAYSNKVPFCSLDAHPNPRYQKSVIGGIPWQSRWAEIMIAADYDMKRVWQGQVDTHINDLKSGVDLEVRKMAGGSARDGEHSESRCWFNRPKQDVARTLLLDGKGDAVLLYRNPVILMTELAVNGKFGTGATTAIDEQFSTKFTRNLPRLAKMFPSLGELLALYRLLDLAVHLKLVGKVELPEEEFWLEGYRHPYQGPSETMPTLTRKVDNIKTPNGKTFIYTVKGGVRMPLTLDPRLFETPTALLRPVLSGNPLQSR